MVRMYWKRDKEVDVGITKAFLRNTSEKITVTTWKVTENKKTNIRENESGKKLKNKICCLKYADLNHYNNLVMKKQKRQNHRIF